MESERRSTMSSLKGQLSNVEGSVKSMKAAVVVGSVLTVACLAAVFGVTILANEVSKEVKVSNGTLSTKNGQAVLTTTVSPTSNLASCSGSFLCKDVSLNLGDKTAVMGVNAVVTEGRTTTIMGDGAIVSVESGDVELTVTDETFAAILGLEAVEEVESRNLNKKWIKSLINAAKKGYGWAKWALGQLMSAIGWGTAAEEVKEAAAEAVK
ncbi:hypothetical protein HOP50_14g73180 [Chloropicon primus]|uniref:Uncharacterized protein n=1 Tax=Chloropicon primus TaxID=1764295 RepID=A0A5B8MW68_9CHLO|nr:hypothetical protein A3770_14p72970 [Chloropicon primus]UPR03987.1 hypothetical protein HOP50_14g73180 [Chloropicon primus]|eukprot:QDZ24779.1 hypothetical protein A3770_14p72970 [Chloropicon primus]